MPLRVQNRIHVQMHPWMLVETTCVTGLNTTSLVHVRAFTYSSVMSRGKMIFAVLEL